MGTVEIRNGQLVIQSSIITYGTAADPAVTENIRDEIETMWNEPQATVILKRKHCRLYSASPLSATRKSHPEKYLKIPTRKTIISALNLLPQAIFHL